MNDDYKKLLKHLKFSEKNNSLSEAYERLASDYDKALSVCDKKRALLDQLFKDNPDL